MVVVPLTQGTREPAVEQRGKETDSRKTGCQDHLLEADGYADVRATRR